MLMPVDEAQRMEMREARCMAEASVEDLTRTLAIHQTEIVAAITRGKAMHDERQSRRSSDQQETPT
jgi:hypothetical protein